MWRISRNLLLGCLVGTLTGCGGSAPSVIPSAAPLPNSEGSLPRTSAQLIKLNQLGFYPNRQKVAVVPAVVAEQFSIVNDADGVTVFKAPLSPAKTWVHSDDTVRRADFSSFTTPGVYRLQVPGLADSVRFRIATDVHADVNLAALKAFYFNRSSTALSGDHAGPWSRNAGHPDMLVLIHSSAASAARPTASLIAAPQGWYDAGDYNKYIVNSGISTYTLLAAFEHFPNYYKNRTIDIPESNDAVPDILNEALWNIRWMLQMQDPNDGGVYHKLTALAFEGQVMPENAVAQRYVVQKSTTAALNFAAVMAVASRVFAAYPDDYPGLATQCREAAINAWNWAGKHPDKAYVQPSDVRTGEYANPGFSDEFAWAAAELYITLRDDSYYQEFLNYRSTPGVPHWGDTMALGYLSLANHRNDVTAVADIDDIQSTLVAVADVTRAGLRDSAFGLAFPITANDFVWGSNSVALNQSILLIQAYRQTSDIDYLQAALGNLDYVFGRNATDYSFVTGFGSVTPLNIHHRASDADGIAEPIPGLLVGGPHPGQQDNCNYPSNLAAKSYVDDFCSYATNEIAINWNAPLVYVTGAAEALQQHP